MIITLILLDKSLDCKLEHLNFAIHHFRALSSRIRLSMWKYMPHTYREFDLQISGPIFADGYFSMQIAGLERSLSCSLS